MSIEVSFIITFPWLRALRGTIQFTIDQTLRHFHDSSRSVVRPTAVRTTYYWIERARIYCEHLVCRAIKYCAICIW